MTASVPPSEPSFEGLLAHPDSQFDLNNELLPHLLAFGPPEQHVHMYPADTSGVARCRCGHVVPPAALAATKPEGGTR